MEIKDQFIEYFGWQNWKQSKLLRPWSKSIREKVKHTTGIDFPEGTKGFPFKLFMYYWRGYECLMDDIFSQRVNNKAFISAKNTLKSRLQYTHCIFMMVNFDNYEEFIMTKYQLALDQIRGNLIGYLSFIESDTGLDLSSYFIFPDSAKGVDTRVIDIRIPRRWSWKTSKIVRKKKNEKKKTKAEKEKGGDIFVDKEIFTNHHFERYIHLRSFDMPNKIANTPPPVKDGFIGTVRIVEPVMFMDPGDVSAQQMSEVWSVNRSSILRYADTHGFFNQMITDMNNWNASHDFISIADRILPYDEDELTELTTIAKYDDNENWHIRRMTRWFNKLVPFGPSAPDWKDAEITRVNNYNLYKAQYFGAPYDDNLFTSWTYRGSMVNNNDDIFISDEDFQNLLSTEKAYIGVGIDYGSSHATTAKASFFFPRSNILVRDAIYRNCNLENKRKDLPEKTSLRQMQEVFIELVKWFKTVAEKSLSTQQLVYFDGGSVAMCQLLQEIVNRYDLSSVLIVVPSPRYGTRRIIKTRIDWDNKIHSRGMVRYTYSNKITFDQYYSTRNKRTNDEERDEKNQLLDECDATNIAETDLRDIIDIKLLEIQKIISIGV